MESLKFHLLLAFLLIAHTILLSHPVFSMDDEYDVEDGFPAAVNINITTDDEDGLIRGINTLRQGLKLSPLAKDAQAECLADKLSNQLKGQPCSATSPFAKAIPASSGQPPFTNYQGLLLQCNINANLASDGVILPVCVPKLAPMSVLGNFTQTYGNYTKESKFTGIGVTTEEDWMLVVLTTKTPQGSTASATAPQVGGAANAASPQASAATPQASVTTPQGGDSTTTEGSGAGAATPQKGVAAASEAVGMVSGMRSGVYMMTLLLGLWLV